MSLFGYKPKWKKRLDLRDLPVRDRAKPWAIKLGKRLRTAIKKNYGVKLHPINSRQKKIRPRSRRMTKLMTYYRQLKAEYLASNPRCVGHDAHDHPATQIHHTRGRAGTLLLDARFWKGVCAGIHDYIGDKPDWAREEGLLCAKGDWNTPPDDMETRRLKMKIQELTL